MTDISVLVFRSPTVKPLRGLILLYAQMLIEYHANLGTTSRLRVFQ